MFYVILAINIHET